MARPDGSAGCPGCATASLHPLDIGYDHNFLAAMDVDTGDIPAGIALLREVRSPDAEDARAASRRLGIEP